MMIPPLTSRILALTLLVFVTSCVWLFLLAPLVDAWSGGGRDWERSTKLLAGYSRNGAGQSSLQESFTKLQQSFASQPGYFDGGDVTVMAAKLQSNVKRFVEAGAGEIKTSQLLPASTVDGFRKINVRVEFLADTENLQRILYDIETASPAMFFEAINVRGSDVPNLDPAARQTSKLTIRCDISGFMRPLS